MTFVALELNHYVQLTNWKGDSLSVATFKGNLRSTEFLERTIAMKKMKMEKHEEKWSEVFSLIS